MRTNAGAVGHDLGNVALLVDTVHQVRHGTSGPDTNIISSMSLRLQRLSGGLVMTKTKLFQRFSSNTFLLIVSIAVAVHGSSDDHGVVSSSSSIHIHEPRSIAIGQY